MFVSAAAFAGEAVRATRHVLMAAAPASSSVNRLRGRIAARFGISAVISFLSGREPAAKPPENRESSSYRGCAAARSPPNEGSAMHVTPGITGLTAQDLWSS